MKKITKEDRDKLNFKRLSQTENKVLFQISLLNVGEYLLVEKSDWKLKSPISTNIGCSCHNPRGFLFKKNIKVTTKTLKDGSGWVIERIL